MSKSYPIWNDITACIYKSDKSFGARDTSQNRIKVGSSINNSHELAEVITTRRFKTDEKHGKICVFKISVDGIVLTEMIFKDNNGRAGKFIKKRTKLNGLKSL